MKTFRVNIAYEFDCDDIAEAEQFARILILEQHIHGSCVPTVGLTRDGDKSQANLLAPIGPIHYKHHKIPITEYKGYNEAQAYGNDE